MIARNTDGIIATHQKPRVIHDANAVAVVAHSACASRVSADQDSVDSNHPQPACAITTESVVDKDTVAPMAGDDEHGSGDSTNYELGTLIDFDAVTTITQIAQSIGAESDEVAEDRVAFTPSKKDAISGIPGDNVFPKHTFNFIGGIASDHDPGRIDDDNSRASVAEGFSAVIVNVGADFVATDGSRVARISDDWGNLDATDRDARSTIAGDEISQ